MKFSSFFFLAYILLGWVCVHFISNGCPCLRYGCFRFLFALFMSFKSTSYGNSFLVHSLMATTIIARERKRRKRKRKAKEQEWKKNCFLSVQRVLILILPMLTWFCYHFSIFITVWGKFSRFFLHSNGDEHENYAIALIFSGLTGLIARDAKWNYIIFLHFFFFLSFSLFFKWNLILLTVFTCQLNYNV